ncbi:uncharacterized protein GIQ15_03184 [Arthroderma uncinatum]|uniref:uncharacterized protein n=1 Tax=Arthroderma uncinatum TaxID=74035 RepID=UPI00144ABD65|nr:uncharacterized protein GIQ15_03184 [Arthroderma uncinatum]KAF3483860.1 hypothetical protein GIQ15_03184 [Arthroderma uncinatum]
MSAPLKRPSEDDDFQEESWEDNQPLAEEDESQESNQLQDPENTSATGEDMMEAPVTESASSTTGATASARRPKKPRRGKNSPEPNYSEMVQDQMSATNRTGQACDRCKTDPITRVSYTRGELERLRADNQTLVAENQLLRAENASLRDYIHNVLNGIQSGPPLIGGSSQPTGMGMGTQHQYSTSYEDLQASQAQAQARAQAIRQAVQQAGPSFPIIYPQSRRHSAVPGLPTMPDQAQFGPVPGAPQYPGYHPSMGQSQYAGHSQVPTPHQQINQGGYRHEPQQQQGGQQGGQQGHSQNQGQEQGESQQPTGMHGSDNAPSQDPTNDFKYFPDI